jgi:hypothetical protein
MLVYSEKDPTREHALFNIQPNPREETLPNLDYYWSMNVWSFTKCYTPHVYPRINRSYNKSVCMNIVMSTTRAETRTIGKDDYTRTSQ